MPRLGPPVRPVLERVFLRVEIDEESGCWRCSLGIDKKGYSNVSVGLGADRRVRKTHRVVYEALVGPIPKGLDLDHVCHDAETCDGGDGDPHRRCVNPEHLAPATNKANALRGNGPGARNKRKTHCVHGHPFDEANTYQEPGRRRCRACSAAIRQARAERRRSDGPFCSINGCEHPAEKRGWCGMHYWRWRSNGDPLVARRKRARRY